MEKKQPLIIICIILISALLGLKFWNSQTHTISSATINIKGMFCQGCSQKISTALTELEGIKSCEINYEKEQCTLSFNPKRINMHTINNTITSLGYTIKEEKQQELKVLKHKVEVNP